MEHTIKKLKRISLLFIGALFIIGCSSKKASTEYLLLLPKEFDLRVKAEKNPQIIDVRTPEEFQNGSMLGANNLNYLDGTFEKSIKALDSTKTVFVFCAKGGRSAKAAELLKSNGFVSVIDLKGGFSVWENSDPFPQQ